ncbi:MAG: leucine-rich repeat protein [Ruminococcus flavefaciens]|nr:leucine-rich repeat protein [Ruminococcus flavefaciens]MCM1228596.1 leucine-rich repeat protein [Ruminococcus flavefaciens]
MKNFKKIISAITALALMSMPVSAVSHAELIEGITDDGFHYVTDGSEGVVINSYDGTNTDIVVPATIDGVPVIYMNSRFIQGSATSVVIPLNEAGILYNQPSLKKVTFLADRISFNGNISGTGIEELVFPSVTRVSKQAFMNCKSLKRVVYSGSVSEVEKSLFEGCTALTELSFLDCNSSVSIESNAFANTGLVNLEISPAVELKDGAFDNCKNLETVTFGNNVSMTGNPFSNCTAIKSVEFKGNVDMQSYAFKDCSSLENFSFDTSKEVNGRFFKYCTNVRYINNELAFDETTGDFNPEYRDFIIKSFGGSDDVGFLNEYVMWHVRDIVSQYTDDSMSDMEKVKILHDWVCDNVSYSPDTLSDSINHNDLSPFLTGITVCDGYGRALNLLLNEAGMETYYVRSNNHIWNIVKLGGHYFHVDSTWNDSEADSTAWFLKSDDEIRTETSSHSEWNLSVPSSLHSFQGDTMPECAYSMGYCNTDGEISVADIVKMNRYILGAVDISPDDSVLFDLDFNGDVDIFDVIKMRGLIAGKNNDIPYSDDLQLMSDWILGKTDSFNPDWDLNGDGRVDVLDVIALRQNITE